MWTSVSPCPEDELTWTIKGLLNLDLSLGSPLAASGAAQTEFRMIDTRADFAATFSKGDLVTDFSVAVEVGFTFASGNDPSAPFVAGRYRLTLTNLR